MLKKVKDRMHKRIWRWGGALLLLALVGWGGGMYIHAQQQTDLAWAQEAGYFSPQVKAGETPSQAEFLQAVMKRVNPPEKGVIVPAGAENHWAAGIYATAKKVGIIDCSCQIKPDMTITLEEGARFVMLAVNLQANQLLVDQEQILKKWQAVPEMKQTLTYQDAATLIRQLHGYLEKLE